MNTLKPIDSNLAINSTSTSISSNNNNKPHLLIGFTGSVASIKYTLLVSQLLEFCEIRVIVSEKAKYFIDLEKLRSLVPVYTDSDEWNNTKKNSDNSNGYNRGDAVLHIELRKWAQYFLIAPLSANTLSLIATGQCPSLLTCVVRAWNLDEIKTKPIIIAPAMNTMMYENYFTRLHMKTCIELGFTVIDPIEKLLACGDLGNGAMAEVNTIVSKVQEIFTKLVTSNNEIDIKEPKMDEELDISAAVNALCPWSGKPIQSDSLTLYKNEVVGFCNPGCRDKFKKAITLFDEDIRKKKSILK